MMTHHTNVADELLASMAEAVEISRGDREPARVHHVKVDDVDVRAIRKRRGLSQAAFAVRYGFSPASIRDWEQRRRRPEQAARVLLRVIDREPEAVERALDVEVRAS